MPDHWKHVHAILPETLSSEQVVARLSAQIRINASEAGEFVEKIRIDAGKPHSDGFRRWSASYLLGPPGSFPPPEPTLLA